MQFLFMVIVFAGAFSGALTDDLTASLGEGRALCFHFQTKDTCTAKKQASPA